MGATVALPLLDSMVPAFAAASKQPARLGWVYVSNGIIQKQFIPPTRTGFNFDLPPILQPLAKYQDQINVLSGLSQLEANTKGDGSGDHTRASAAWLTGVHAYDRTAPGVATKLAVTADQGPPALWDRRPVPSLEMTVDTRLGRVPAIRATASTSTPFHGAVRQRRTCRRISSAHRV